MEREIGEAGDYLNNSVATRAVNIEPDMRKVRRLDVFHRHYRNLLLGWGLGAVVLLGAGLGLWQAGHRVWGGLLSVLALPVGYLALGFRQTLQGDAYRNGLLIPGISSSLDPLTITCLADVRTGGGDDDFEEEDEADDQDDEDDEAAGPAGRGAAGAGRVVWGVKQVVIKALTVQPERLGEQVPCVALFGGEDDSEDSAYYTAFEPRPLAWGTAQLHIIEQARQAIPDKEWALLPPLAVAYASSEKNDSAIAYFDAALRPVSLAKPAAADPAPQQV